MKARESKLKKARIIRSLRPPRRGWEKRFKAMAKHGDDRLLDADIGSSTRWDEDEWEWQSTDLQVQ